MIETLTLPMELPPIEQTLDPPAERQWVKWLAVVVVCTALGLVCVQIADAGSRRGSSGTSVFFWIGLLLIFVPGAFAALREDADRRERLALVVLLGAGLYLVKVLGSPHSFAFSDEFTHLRNTQNILRTDRLFAYNPLLPTAAYYPGLAALTAGFVKLTGLTTFASGVVVIAASRVLVSLCIFLVAERVTGSSRAAAGASLVYAANPLFLFWASSFSYENLALPLAVFVIWWLGRTRHIPSGLPQAVTILGIGAVTVTHHVVGFTLAAVLLVWWFVEGRTEPTPQPLVSDAEARGLVGIMAVIAGAATLSWFFFVAKPAASYLFTNNIFPALRQTGSLLIGRTSARHLYASGGFSAPRWETLAGVAAVLVLLAALPPALYIAWRRRQYAPMLIVMGAAIAFPFSLAPRLAPDGVAISGRSSEYLFAGLGCVLGLLVDEVAWRRRQRRPGFDPGATRKRWQRTAVLTVLLTVVFVGEVTVGTAFYERLPETSKPTGYPWAVQPDVITASKWAQTNLGTNRRFGSTAIDSFALATYGEQNTISENKVWRIFFAPTMNIAAVNAIKASQVDYLLVDTRMIHGVPPTPGYYFSPQEPGAAKYKNVFPAAALHKFAVSPCVTQIYNHGAVKIFDVSRIATGACVPLGARGTPPRKPVK